MVRAYRVHLNEAFTVRSERLRTDAPVGGGQNLPSGPGGHREQVYIVAAARGRELAAGRGGYIWIFEEPAVDRRPSTSALLLFYSSILEKDKSPYVEVLGLPLAYIP